MTVINLPTSYWQLVTKELSAENITFLSSVRLMIIGGEPILRKYLDLWLNQVGDRICLLNTYGLTEGTAISTICELSKLAIDDSESGDIPIGCAIDNVQTYVLDRYLNPVPIGIPGELYIGGAGLARGYFNNPELTAERFIANPFRSDLNDRLYKTGDRVRVRTDRKLEFLGRNDYQVKIRGYRIELGEIESVLIQYPGVADVVAVAREDSPGDKRLVAYVVPRFELTPTLGELRRWVKGRLPEYMVPDTFVLLDTLPLTPNGKIDRRSLPPPGIGRSELERDFVAPRTPVEEILAKIWSEVLRLERVGIHTDFFELGGHSLLAIQVISRVREVFHVEMSLRAIFENPTIAGLADSIEKLRIDKLTEDSTILPHPRKEPVPVSLAQEWMLDFIRRMDLEGQPFFRIHKSITFKGALNVEILKASLDKVVERHETLRTTFKFLEGQWVQVIRPAQENRTPLIDLQMLSQEEQDAEVRRLAKAEAEEPFDLYEGTTLANILAST